jgi:predicted amidophosphoribosyltransferase
MKLQTGYWADFVSLLFPEPCKACAESVVTGEDLLCLDCRYNLPFTDFHLKPDNMVAQQFWGKIKLEGAYAMCCFAKGGKIQHLMHNFKYKGVQRIGNLLGNIAGEQLSKSPGV